MTGPVHPFAGFEGRVKALRGALDSAEFPAEVQAAIHHLARLFDDEDIECVIQLIRVGRVAERRVVVGIRNRGRTYRGTRMGSAQPARELEEGQ